MLSHHWPNTPEHGCSFTLAPINKLLYGITEAFTSTKNEPNFIKEFVIVPDSSASLETTT